MNQILVTGAAGLIGRHLVRALAGKHKAFAVRHHVGNETQTQTPCIEADLAQRGFVERLPDGIDAVVHLAQSSQFRDFPGGALDVFRVNVDSTCELLDWARRTGVRRFVLASSGGIYGHGSEAFSEEQPVGAAGPLGFYLASKHCAELLTESYASEMTVVILRFFFVYGPGQRRSMLVPRLVESVAQGRAVTLQGNDGLRLNPVHVDDAVRAVISSLNLQESHKINIGGPEVLSLREMVEIIGKKLGRRPIYKLEPDKEPKHLIADVSKMSHLLAPSRVFFADGCDGTIRDLGPTLVTHADCNPLGATRTTTR